MGGKEAKIEWLGLACSFDLYSSAVVYSRQLSVYRVTILSDSVSWLLGGKLGTRGPFRIIQLNESLLGSRFAE